MSFYWPANVQQYNNVWITTLVDWAGVISVGSNPQESIVGASRNLSDAVRHRIENNLNIPLRSETKPGQSHIEIDHGASLLYESYLEKLQDKQVKLLREIEQVSREKRAGYLTEFRANLDPVERRAENSSRAMVDFASIAINSSFIMNGGALVAIPAILEFSNDNAISEIGFIVPSILFVIGIVLSSITNYFAYRSANEEVDAHNEEASARAIVVQDSYYPLDNSQENQEKIEALREGSNKKFKRSAQFGNAGVLTFVFSVVFFVGGVLWVIASLSLA